MVGSFYDHIVLILQCLKPFQVVGLYIGHGRKSAKDSTTTLIPAGSFTTTLSAVGSRKSSLRPLCRRSEAIYYHVVLGRNLVDAFSSGRKALRPLWLRSKATRTVYDHVVAFMIT